MEARPDVEANKESLVPAFVSLSNGIDCLAMNQRVTNLNEHFSRMIRHHVLDASKKIKRREYILLLVPFVIGTLCYWYPLLLVPLCYWYPLLLVPFFIGTPFYWYPLLLVPFVIGTLCYWYPFLLAHIFKQFFSALASVMFMCTIMYKTQAPRMEPGL